jgi:hypothetical protein
VSVLIGIEQKMRDCEIEHSIPQKLKLLVVTPHTVRWSRPMRERSLKPAFVEKRVAQSGFYFAVVLHTQWLPRGHIVSGHSR